ncbi:glycoside hydrolase family 30 protein [Botrimarina hoheduenensis]|uniref:O-Glycosyl hydrolase family 30 n=1 Tax=Botrimarina hoheduenensis TaxID=2528000 RepID=A0A5C5WCC9_9BACT|nr:glycoside hydrolase family 30 beta sandwich domain-containing protein [Botrimarina hoheduenensis]TWT47749.1 O-Glycosyl hydrolase family 30 [Botrimarina hoheduenensis]
MLKQRRMVLAAMTLVLVNANPADAVDVWITSGDKSRLLSQQTDVVFQNGTGSGGVGITIDASQTFQTMRGYGAAMTNSSASLLQNSLNPAQRDRAMDDLFSSDDGIGLNYLRLAMGASDFTADGFYTYNDLGPNQTDPALAGFSIDPDRPTILPSLDAARARNADLQLMASPWSAPGWMKTNGSVIGGQLAPQWHGAYATYLQKFVEAYAAEGHPIDTLTLQNEPLFTPTSYPGMSMPATQQIDLIKNHVGPNFAAAGLTTQLLAYDHNWDNTAYPLAVLNDPVARQYVAGTAFHGYAGDVSAQSVVRNAHPDKEIYFTEVTGGDFAPVFEDNLIWYARNLLIGGARNWGATVLLWNLALDENGDPHLGGCSDCRGVITVNSQSGAVTHNEEFYSLGHASQHVQPGAVRIGSNSINNLIETVAFQNPDGSQVLLALNPTPNPLLFRAVRDGKNFRYTLPARSVATFAWDADDRADFGNGGFEQGGYHTSGGSLDGWLPWGVTSNNVRVTNSQALDGQHALLLSGPGGTNGFAGASQAISVTAGERLRIDASVLLPNVGSIAGTDNQVLMKIEYYSVFDGQFQSANFLGQEQITLATGATPTGQWIASALDGTAPAGAVEARLVFVFSQPSGLGGSALVDGVSFGVVPNLAGDFNNDGVVNAADYTVWRDGLGTTYTQADYQIWRDNFGATLPSASASNASAQSIPEPAAASFLAAGLLCWGGVRSLPVAARLR